MSELRVMSKFWIRMKLQLGGEYNINVTENRILARAQCTICANPRYFCESRDEFIFFRNKKNY